VAEVFAGLLVALVGVVNVAGSFVPIERAVLFAAKYAGARPQTVNARARPLTMCSSGRRSPWTGRRRKMDAEDDNPSFRVFNHRGNAPRSR